MSDPVSIFISRECIPISNPFSKYRPQTLQTAPTVSNPPIIVNLLQTKVVPKIETPPSPLHPSVPVAPDRPPLPRALHQLTRAPPQVHNLCLRSPSSIGMYSEGIGRMFRSRQLGDCGSGCHGADRGNLGTLYW